MRHVREILRLECAEIFRHQIARQTGVVPSTVREHAEAFCGFWQPLDCQPVCSFGKCCACRLCVRRADGLVRAEPGGFSIWPGAQSTAGGGDCG